MALALLRFGVRFIPYAPGIADFFFPGIVVWSRKAKTIIKILSLCLCMWLWRVLFFVTDRKLVKNRGLQRELDDGGSGRPAEASQA